MPAAPMSTAGFALAETRLVSCRPGFLLLITSIRNSRPLQGFLYSPFFIYCSSFAVPHSLFFIVHSVSRESIFLGKVYFSLYSNNRLTDKTSDREQGQGGITHAG